MALPPTLGVVVKHNDQAKFIEIKGLGLIKDLRKTPEGDLVITVAGEMKPNRTTGEEDERV